MLPYRKQTTDDADHLSSSGHISLICNIYIVLLFMFLFSDRFFTRRGRRARDRMVVGFTTTYAISAYPH
jgi:hypothetical protein